MKKVFNKKNILRFLGLAAGFLLLWVALNWKHIRAFPDIISSFYSKEFCSCFFITGRGEAACHNYARQYVPISDFSLDKEKKQVTVTGLWQTNKASYLGPLEGCRLVAPNGKN